MFRLLNHTLSKGGFILDRAVVRIEVIALEVGEGPRNAPGAGEETLAVTRRHHGENEIADARHRHAVGASAELHP
jgi:hypothetical protein